MCSGTRLRRGELIHRHHRIFVSSVYRGCIYVCMYIWNYSMIRTFEEKFDTSVGWLLLSFQLVMELLE